MKAFVGFQLEDSERKRLAEYQRIEKIPSASAAARCLLRAGLDAARVPGGEPTVRNRLQIPKEQRMRAGEVLEGKEEVKILDVVAVFGSPHLAGRYLRDLGYQRIQKRIGNKREWVFRRSLATPIKLSEVAEKEREDADSWVRNLGLKPETILKEALTSDAAALARKTGGSRRSAGE